MLFARLALHGFKMQCNADFDGDVLVGETLPEDAKAHLRTRVHVVPQIRLITRHALSIAYTINRLTTVGYVKFSTAMFERHNAKNPFAIGFRRGS
jgi:hypothetical protein